MKWRECQWNDRGSFCAGQAAAHPLECVLEGHLMETRTRRPLVPTLVLLAAVSFAFLGAARAQTNLVTNPGFETGDFTGYTVTRDPEFGSYLTVASDAANTGNYGAVFGNRDLYFDTISQALDTAGATTFQVSFSRRPSEPTDPGRR